jgi:hypothetical protein
MQRWDHGRGGDVVVCAFAEERSRRLQLLPWSEMQASLKNKKFGEVKF